MSTLSAPLRHVINLFLFTKLKFFNSISFLFLCADENFPPSPFLWACFFYVRTSSSFLLLISFRVITYDLHSYLSSALTPFWIFGLFGGSEWNSRVFSLKLLLKEAQKKVRPLRLKLETNQSFRRSCRKKPSISVAKFVMVIKSFETCCKHRERVRMEISGLDRDTSTN